MAELKTKQNDASVAAFLNGIEDETKRADCWTLVKLMRQATKAEPKMWGGSIVGFGDYHYRYASGREGDWMRMGFSPRKQNLVLYITSGFEPHQALLEQLGDYSTGKSCLYIKRLESVNLKVLKQLIKQASEQTKNPSPPAKPKRTPAKTRRSTLRS